MLAFAATGCGVSINGKEYTFFETPKHEDLNILESLGSQESRDQNLTEVVKDGNSLEVSVPAGNINIRKSSDSNIEIRAEKKVRGSNSDTKNLILDNMNLYLNRDGQTVKVDFKTKDGNDFWKWLKENYKTYQVYINYDIKIPENIKALDIKDGAGNIDISETNSAYKLNTGAGNIEIRDAVTIGESEISSGAGNINIRTQLGEFEDVEVNTGAGNISLRVPGDSKMGLSVDTGVGNVQGSIVKSNNLKNHQKKDINGGGSDVKLHSGVGNIDVDEL
jgi:hypothetical protein